jgi:ornithine cyclodeaminase/alanine dehydrogenase-like protein (mu-crystallin family)
MNVRVLSQSDVNLALPMIQAIDAMTTAFVALAADRVIMPERLHIDVAKHQGVALFMPSYIEDLGYFAIKTVSLFDNNHTQNLPRLQGTVSLFDATNGCLCAIIDAAELTAIRTTISVASKRPSNGLDWNRGSCKEAVRSSMCGARHPKNSGVFTKF